MSKTETKYFAYTKALMVVEGDPDEIDQEKAQREHGPGGVWRLATEEEIRNHQDERLGRKSK